MDLFGPIVYLSVALAGQGGEGQAPQGGLGGSMLFPMIIIFMIFYFLLIRPQTKKQKEHQNMLGELKKGDRIITSGGIYGTIVGISDDIIQLKIGDKVKIKLNRSAITGLVKDEPEAN